MTARIAVLADDLIWASRLVDLVEGAGATPVRVRSGDALAAALPDVDGVIVDLTARGYDAVASIGAATRAGRPVVAVGQHDDRETRRRALEAGASRVHPYRRLFEDGPRQLRAWLDEIAPLPATAP